MGMSEKTRLEMEAGARQLAVVRGEDLSPEYMAAALRTQERDAQLRRWITGNKVKVLDPARYIAGTVRYKRDLMPDTPTHVVLKVLPDGPEFTDKEAEKNGGYPSELLIANLALALQAKGML